MIALSTLTPVLRVLHLFVTLAMIGVVLIQRSEGGGLGIGTTQGMGSFMSGRGTANLLTRTTAILGTLFFAISLSLPTGHPLSRRNDGFPRVTALASASTDIDVAAQTHLAGFTPTRLPV